MTAPTEVQGRGFETAAEHSTAAVPVAAPGDSVADMRRSLWGRRFETAAAVAVTEQDRLVGLIRMEDLIAAPDGLTAADVMDRDRRRDSGGDHRAHAQAGRFR